MSRAKLILPACVLLLLVSWCAAALAQTQPQRPRIGANQIPNPGFNGTANWFFDGNAVYDATTSRTADGSGSMRFGAASSRVWQTTHFPLTVGKSYTFAVYIKSQSWPSSMTDFAIGVYNAAGTNIVNIFMTHGANSGAGLWEEITATVTAEAGAAYAMIQVTRLYEEPNPNAFLWVDDAYFGEGVGFASPPTAKIPFDGVGTKIDALGNVTINKGGTFTPVFPLCIYGDARGGAARWQLYSNQGFNCEMWGDASTLPWAAQATSTFNPTGMMAGVQVAQYMNQGGWGWDINGVNLGNLIAALKATGYYQSHFLWYYWDNENIFAGWNDQMRAASQIQAADKLSGQPAHPLYGLQGACNVARAYHNGFGITHAMGMTGAYVGQANTGAAGAAGCIENLQNLEHQDEPVVVAQANIVYRGQPPGGLRQIVYDFVSSGAKAVGLWRDCYNDPSCNAAGGDDVTLAGWWADVPNLRRELDQLLPVIRQPHWTTWTASHNAAVNTLTLGTRDYNGKGHLILTNKGSAQTFTLTVSGLAYTPTRLLNYFTGAQVATFSGNTATVTMPALGINSGTAVYVLDGTGTGSFPSITSASAANGSVGTAFTYQITGTNSPTSYNATPLPAGLTVSTTSGLISGTPTAAGTTTVTLSATNATGTGTLPLALTITQPPLAPQLLVHWKFDEGTLSVAHDATGHGTDGTLMAAPLWTAGRVGKGSLTFDGVTQYVTNTALTWPPSQPVTVALWVKTPGGAQTGAFGIGGSANERFGAHIPWEDNKVYLQYGGGCCGDGSIGADFTPYLNKWTQVALVSNGLNFKAIYINGKLATSSSVALAPAVTLTGLEVGRYGFAGFAPFYATGQIDDFRLYTYALSAQEVSQLYMATAGMRRHTILSIK